MTAHLSASRRVWTVAEAETHFSEILRLAETEGPQRIGVQRAFVVVSEKVWQERASERKPLGQWLVENMPRGIELELPERCEPEREIPFITNENR